MVGEMTRCTLGCGDKATCTLPCGDKRWTTIPEEWRPRFAVVPRYPTPAMFAAARRYVPSQDMMHAAWNQMIQAWEKERANGQ